MQEQKNKLDQLEDRKAKVEKRLTTVTSDLENKEKKTQEDKLQLSTLRQSLVLMSEREREVTNEGFQL